MPDIPQRYQHVFILVDTQRYVGPGTQIRTDALDPQVSDFTPITEEIDNLYLSSAEHAAMVEIDEQGIKGAAYVDFGLLGGGIPKEREEIDFILDRPFIFVVYSSDGSVLFEGIVRNIE